MSYQLAGKRVRPKVFYYAYAPSTHSHTRCSRTGSDMQLNRSCRLGHSPYREAKTTKRVEEFFGFSKLWIFADKRRSCVISTAVFDALFKLLTPSKNLHWGATVHGTDLNSHLRVNNLVQLNWIWISTPIPVTSTGRAVDRCSRKLRIPKSRSTQISFLQ